MLARLEAAIIVLLALAWPEPGVAQSCVQSGVASHAFHTCAFTRGGSAMCWGDNSRGALGNGKVGGFNVPVPVVLVGGVVPDGIVAGWWHSCAISGPNHSPVCWGSDRDGQLGDGNNGLNCSRVQINLTA